jgi:flagellar motor switch protein FliN
MTDVPESKVPESKLPEAKVPEAEVVENKIPENPVPESKVPESKVPENQVLENKVPEVLADHAAAEPHPQLRAELRNWCETWKICLQGVLSQVSGGAPGNVSGQSDTFETSFQPLPVADSDVWYTVVAGGVVHGEMTLRLPAASGTRLARKFLGETEPAVETVAAEPITTEHVTSEPISSEHKEALEELLRQIAGLAATALAANTGGEVQLHLSASAAPSWSSDAVVCLQTRNEAGTSISIEIQISPALGAELQSRVQPAPPAKTLAQPSPSSPTLSSLPPSSGYGRLMEVGLDVKLRFGTRRMLLRDVLALSAGVVVELESTLHSPVDLLLEGRLIAQGEVVIVDGKYGLRITDVVDTAPAFGSPV